MIPKFSAPLTKLIRTLEGLIWVGANVALVIAPIVSSNLSAADSIKWGAIMNTVVFASRTALKGLALAKGFGYAPAQLLSTGNLTKIEGVAGQVAGDVASDVSKGATTAEVLAQIQAAEDAALAVQAKPGTPAGDVKVGLSPTAVADAGSKPIDVPAK